MSVYGDMLALFPELLQEYQIFSMEPKVGGGYLNRRPLYKRTGAFIKGARSRMAVAGEARVTNEQGVFYCYISVPDDDLRQGVYFQEGSQIFVIIDDQTFAKEAGFGAYTCQLVQGITDQQVENQNVTSRTIADYPI